MRNRVQHTALLAAALLSVLLLPAAAQVTLGDNVNLNLSGTISAGYSGSYDGTTSGYHGLDAGGNADLRGYYYNPRFISFNLQPYYRRAQNNSAFQTITNGSGLINNVSLFSGSHFPGYVSYSRTFDNTGQFGIPGIGGLESHGNGRNFTLGWSALLPNMPSLTASYSTSAGSSTVYGSNAESQSASRNLTLTSTHTLAGFHLTGQYVRLSSDADFPAWLEGGQAQSSTTTSNSITVVAQHSIPLHGSWTTGWSHTGYQGGYQGGTTRSLNQGTFNDVNSMFSLNPIRKLGLGFGVDYNDNTYGALQQQILAAGGSILPNLPTTMHSVSTTAQASYTIFSHLAVYGRVSHYEIWSPTTSRGTTQFGGNAAFNFKQRLLGALNFSVGVVDTATQEGNSGASLVGNVNFVRQIHAWEASGDFGYTQQVQTLDNVYTTSMYSYGARVRRRFDGIYWTGSFRGTHSGLQQYEGYSSRTEGFSTSIRYGRFTVNGHYSQSSGASVLTPSGLVVVPGVPAPLLPQPVLYNAKGYGGGLGFTPFRRCAISATYSKANSGNTGPGMASAFQSKVLNARLDYRLRKLNLEGNFTRFEQSIATATLPSEVNTYYIRVSRWFNIF